MIGECCACHQMRVLGGASKMCIDCLAWDIAAVRAAVGSSAALAAPKLPDTIPELHALIMQHRADIARLTAAVRSLLPQERPIQ